MPGKRAVIELAARLGLVDVQGREGSREKGEKNTSKNILIRFERPRVGGLGGPLYDGPSGPRKRRYRPDSAPK